MAQPARPAPRTTASRAGTKAGDEAGDEPWGAASRPTSISRLLAKPGRFSVAKPASFSAPRTKPATHQVARVASDAASWAQRRNSSGDHMSGFFLGSKPSR
jgi:hypothetical protein